MKQNYDLNVLNILGTAAPASPEPAPLPPEEENEQKRRKAAVKLLVMSAFVLIIIAFWSAAWFARNTSTTANGMGVSVAGDAFRLATSQNKVSYEAQLKLVNAEYEKGTSISLPDKFGTTGTYYMLDGSQSLILQCTANPDDETGQSGDKNVEPSDWDKLNLYIVPTENGTVSATINVEVIPYAEIPVKDANGDQVYKTDEDNNFILDSDNNKIPVTQLIRVSTQAAFETDAARIHNSQAVTDAALYVTAANYLKGHIMFFGAPGDTTNSTESLRYYFSAPYTTRQFVFSETNASRNVAYEVPLYWMWPNTLGQIALSSSTNRKGYPVVADSNFTDKNKLIQYLKDNKPYVFANYTDITDAMITNASNEDNFKLLSEGYNKADLSIGTYISYFMIEITVENQ